MGAERDGAIDIVRGWCVVSMATAHLAMGSAWWSVMHAPGWIDGAVGFVLLSGVVVGLTQHRTVQRRGLAAAQRKTARRIALLYSLHIALCVMALGLTSAYPSQSGRLPSITAEGGGARAIWHVLTLRVNPPTASILALYAVMSLLTIVVIVFLTAGLPLIALGVSAAVYVYGLLFPTYTTFPERAYVPGYVNWATWQALFVLAILVGWHWRDDRVQRMVRSNRVLACALLACLGLGSLGYADTHRAAFASSDVQTPLRWLFGNSELGPGTMVFGFLAVLVLYRLAALVCTARLGQALLLPLRLLGRRSLDSYVLIAAVSIISPVVMVYRPDGWEGVALALCVLAAAIGWALARSMWASRSTRFGPKATTGSTAPMASASAPSSP